MRKIQKNVNLSNKEWQTSKKGNEKSKTTEKMSQFSEKIHRK